ncbi:MAG: PIN domain-containing protein [Halobacteria archaeon]
MAEPRPAVFDSNVFISSLKGDEKASPACTDLIRRIADGAVRLVEPAVLLAEVVDAVGRHRSAREARRVEGLLRDMVAHWVVCDVEFCSRAGHTGYAHRIYGTDALYLQTALDHGAALVSLDRAHFVQRVKSRGADACSPAEFLLRV